MHRIPYHRPLAEYLAKAREQLVEEGTRPALHDIILRALRNALALLDRTERSVLPRRARSGLYGERAPPQIYALEIAQATEVIECIKYLIRDRTNSWFIMERRAHGLSADEIAKAFAKAERGVLTHRQVSRIANSTLKRLTQALTDNFPIVRSSRRAQWSRDNGRVGL